MSDSSGPARTSKPVSPSDTVDLAAPAKALYIGVAGDVAILDSEGNYSLFKAHPVGYMRVNVKRVINTGTTATNILALNG